MAAFLLIGLVLFPTIIDIRVSLLAQAGTSQCNYWDIPISGLNTFSSLVLKLSYPDANTCAYRDHVG